MTLAFQLLTPLLRHPKSTLRSPKTLSPPSRSATRIHASVQQSAPRWSRLFDAQILQTPSASPSRREQEPVEVKQEGLSLERIRKLIQVSKRLTIPFFQADRLAIWHLLACVVLVFFSSLTRIAFTTVSGDMMTSLSEKQVSQFGVGMAKLFFTCLAAFPLSPLSDFARGTFTLRWSQFLTKRGLSLYFQKRNFYRLSNLRDESNGVDNPDEVIQDQFGHFANSIVHIFLSNLRTIIDVVLYSTLLIRIYPPIFLVIVGMVSIGSLIINTIGKRLVNLEAEFLRRAADFRFALARVRIHAESIAFYSGDKVENEYTESKLDAQAETRLSIYKTELPVNMFVDSFFFLPAVIPLVLLAPRFFAGKMPLGDLTKASSAFNNVFVDLSIFIRNYSWYASLGASWGRLSRYVSTVESVLPADCREFQLQNDDDTRVHTRHRPTIKMEQGNVLSLRNVSVLAPNGLETIVHNVNLNVTLGDRVLIVGRSGRGKTSLLRAIAGLWTMGDGVITRPGLGETLFLPQRAYTRLGTLREQLEYPQNRKVEDGELVKVLEEVGLEGLVERTGGLDVVQDWSEYLSAGESQRVGFARVVLADAKLVLVDEGTSAMDLNAERKVMEVLSRKGCAVVSVGHRPSLVEFHERVLLLEEDGAKVISAERFQFPGV